MTKRNTERRPRMQDSPSASIKSSSTIPKSEPAPTATPNIPTDFEVSTESVCIETDENVGLSDLTPGKEAPK